MISPTAASDIQRSTRDDTDAQSKTGKEPVNGPHSDDSATPEQLHIVPRVDAASKAQHSSDSKTETSGVLASLERQIGERLSLDKLTNFMEDLGPYWNDLAECCKVSDKVRNVTELPVPEVVKVTAVLKAWTVQTSNLIPTWRSLFEILDQLKLYKVIEKVQNTLQRAHSRPSPEVSLPKYVDERVPLKMEMLWFVSEVANNWDRIGHCLNVSEKVFEIEKDFPYLLPEVKMSIIFDAWLKQEPSPKWTTLLTVLDCLGLGEVVLRTRKTLQLEYTYTVRGDVDERDAGPPSCKATDKRGGPVSFGKVIMFAPDLASHWKEIGERLGVLQLIKQEVLQVLVSDSLRMTVVLGTWVQQSKLPSWESLMQVLDRLKLSEVTARICQTLQEECEETSQLPELPDDIDKIVPLGMDKLADFANDLGPYWDLLGYSLKVLCVPDLRETNYLNFRKALIVLQTWTDQEEASWKTLLAVLNRLKLRGIESKIRRFLVSEMNKI